MTEVKIISSLEKCFPDQSVGDFNPLSTVSVLKGERLSFQFIYKETDPATADRSWARVTLKGRLAKKATVRTVECVPSLMPCYHNSRDDNYLRTAPGLYPDLLQPVGNLGYVPIPFNELRSVWITVDGLTSAGNSTVTATLETPEGAFIAKASLKIRIIDSVLPPQTLKVTQWFHGDCIAEYYDCEVFSRKWWKITKSFVSTAVRNGQNMLLTPVFTSPLDTMVGGERLTVQLVGVEKSGDDYRFDYANLDRWLDMCDRAGIRYYEISHFFTQWGAAHAPKVMATENGVYKKIFGWETDATGENYSRFIRAFLADFLAHMKAKNLDKRCFFHISDEPNTDNLAQYLKSKSVVSDLLAGYTVMDALSHFEFYASGAVSTPIPSNNNIQPFIDAKVPSLWTYYCCGQNRDNVSNRFFSMPSWRNRAIGFQFFKYDIAGFLQWGYNFYSSQNSLSPVNPYLDSTGNYFTPSGDCYSVYPSQDGNALESLRLCVFYEALQDLRACGLCSKLIGKDETVKILEEELGEIRFNSCPYSAAPLLKARERINLAIENALAK